MHAYASDSTDRRLAPWILAILAVLVAYGYCAVITHLNFAPPWWIEAPSIMTTYGVLHLVYKHYAWRWHPLGFRLSHLPDFGGTWFGTLESSHNGGTTIQGMMYVAQSWSDLCVEFESEKSRSHSLMAVVNVTPGITEGLTFEYINAPRNDAAQPMHAHVGLNQLRLTPDGKSLDGDYFSGRDRQTIGRVKLIRLTRAKMTFDAAAAKYRQMTASRENNAAQVRVAGTL